MAASSPLQSSPRQKLGSKFALSGCRPFPLSAAEMADYDGRYEYWEAGIAWELRDVSPKHERPSVRLAELLGDIAKIRGTPIEMFRTADLQERGVGGTRIRAAQADELVYLDYHYAVPDVFVVRELPLPDVVFEVDLTTDIRDRKLDVYAAWGVPELWVEVPDADLPSKRKRPGLTIHLLEGGRFRQSAESVAFPTLTAHEIHAALNEPGTSAATVDTARRVGAIMGQRAGTGPDGDPFLRVERKISRRDGRMSMLEGVLGARGIRATPRLQAEADRIDALPHDAVVAAALESTDLDDFLRRLRPRPRTAAPEVDKRNSR